MTSARFETFALDSRYMDKDAELTKLFLQPDCCIQLSDFDITTIIKFDSWHLWSIKANPTPVKNTFTAAFVICFPTPLVVVSPPPPFYFVTKSLCWVLGSFSLKCKNISYRLILFQIEFSVFFWWVLSGLLRASFLASWLWWELNQHHHHHHHSQPLAWPEVGHRFKKIGFCYFTKYYSM